MKVHLGVPCGEDIKTHTALDLIALAGENRLSEIQLQIDTYCDRSHNAIVERFLQTSADALLFVDSDMLFPADTLQRLAAKNVNIIGATYRQRQPPHQLMTTFLNGASPNESNLPTGWKEVEWIPSGLMLVRREAFNDLPYPWFPNVYGKKGEDFVGSDLSFCRKARGLGRQKIFCDFDLSHEVSHLATIPLSFTL